MDTIRPATLGDAADIAAIGLTLGYETSPPVSALGAILDDPTQTLLVACDETGHAVAWIHGVIVLRAASAPFAEIVGLAVRDDHRRRGVGSALVAGVAAWAASARGIDRLRARVNVVREGALDFYHGAGFRETKRQVVFEKRLK